MFEPHLELLGHMLISVYIDLGAHFPSFSFAIRAIVKCILLGLMKRFLFALIHCLDGKSFIMVSNSVSILNGRILILGCSVLSLIISEQVHSIGETIFVHGPASREAGVLIQTSWSVALRQHGIGYWGSMHATYQKENPGSV